MKSCSLCTAGFTLALALCLASTAISAAINDEPKSVVAPKIIVHVMNGLKPGSLPLSVHCLSADDNLGCFDLPMGEEFKWRFSNKIWASGRFYCNFWWDSKHIKLDLYANKYEVIEGNMWLVADEVGILLKSDNHPTWLRQCHWGFNADDYHTPTNN